MAAGVALVRIDKQCQLLCFLCEGLHGFFLNMVRQESSGRRAPMSVMCLCTFHLSVESTANCSISRNQPRNVLQKIESRGSVFIDCVPISIPPRW